MFTDLVSFQPWVSLFGGALIGLAAVLLLAINGKIAGISGIVGGLLKPSSGDVGWRLAFIAGLLASPLLLAATGFSLGKGEIDLDLGAVLLGGLLVGFGARLGSGCTSGHGVIGLARLSRRSVAATISFMAAGFLMVSLIHFF
ncbi:YeeE/YedE family protein [Acidithiobacillus sp. CV18-2]|uniref:YeeE/YedE family protein n=1 Tax=Igneacidithiobacillus copahuensis TaxID=2724909 RepID=A0AAE2YPW9_9PROT|nr:YeeE/YedE thiosulfate transporter family protein [Igneacidithiobacillus copahuensis]MBU2755591.1 YeeE/YedE family protein [Acidithiobacillus sp. CV18-3]MBU2756672.1 YeeE/YedE family protein [Acidithiobacillus sp. BN09-2]MBU2777586.1 YeeE/YedE family protein [Acidithiobacillus sp. CV18-2]MBU2795230.1 YeeE/YedE family protein [Acidithiobacillus sp. VAN18-2]MBU2799269.1 YeeE/YedE family protein [Acidithiobacillus sp. VAN18-4]UTV81342.1 YeeE/YedE family protein [Acidithiobacillus sp. YTS05]